jgi:hypothetical protein
MTEKSQEISHEFGRVVEDVEAPKNGSLGAKHINDRWKQNQKGAPHKKATQFFRFDFEEEGEKNPKGQKRDAEKIGIVDEFDDHFIG